MRVLKQHALRLYRRLKLLEWNALGAFTSWFASGGGVYQTLFVVLAVVVFEFADRGVDPHAFVLMAVLTVYSAVTQPALAHSGQRQSDKLDGVLARMEGLEVSIYEMDQRIYDVEQRILAALQNASVAGQAEEIEQIGRTTSDDRGNW